MGGEGWLKEGGGVWRVGGGGGGEGVRSGSGSVESRGGGGGRVGEK